MISPNIGTAVPVKVVVPEKVIALEVSVEVELLTKFPFSARAFDPALNVPPLRVRMPFTVIGLVRVTVPLLPIVKLLNAVVDEGNSDPVLPLAV